ncbi:MAG: GNAT family N-acetyltransferase [Bacteroidota bacterium]|jgi:predicted acetyltransferase
MAVVSNTISLNKVQYQDTKKIAALANTIWNEYYISIISQEQIDYMLCKMYSVKALSEQIDNGQNFYTINIEGTDIGFISVSEIKPEEWMLHKFYINGNHRKKGMGSVVFKELLKTLKTPELIRLTVNRQNFKSINFYFKNGFIIESVEDFDIGNGYFMNDFVMIWNKK